MAENLVPPEAGRVRKKLVSERLLVGVLGIEPSLHEPESCVLPVYDTPPMLKLRRAGPPAIKFRYYKLFTQKNKSPARDETPVVVVAGGYHTHWRFRLLVGHRRS